MGGGTEEGEDRISKLSDELIHEIFKDLDSRVTVRTCILSKRWVNLWTTHPCLNVYYSFKDTHHHFVGNFLKNRNPEFAISTFEVDRGILNRRTIKYLLDHDVEHLFVCSGSLNASPRLKSTSLKTLYLSHGGRRLYPMHWTLPSLTSLHLEFCYFGTEISGFPNLTDLTLINYNLFDGVFNINCPNLKTLTFGGGTHCDKLVVSAPNLSCFKIDCSNVPELHVADGFPCIKEVDLHFGICYRAEENMLNLIMQNLITIFKAVRRTRLLKISEHTFQVLHRIPDLSGYRPCPFDNLKLLSLQGIQEMPTRSTDHVIKYLLSNSPSAEMLKAK